MSIAPDFGPALKDERERLEHMPKAMFLEILEKQSTKIANRQNFRKRLSPHFMLSEFIHDDDAEAFRRSDMRSLFEHRLTMVCRVLELVRAELDMPLVITSGWRSSQRNKAIGGAKFSDHPTGYAVDVMCPYLNASKLGACFLSAYKRKLVDYDQLIIYPKHVHVSIAPRLRGETFNKGY